MSLELVATIICDGCKRRYAGKTEHRFGRAKIYAQNLRRQAELDGWQSLSRGGFHTDSHYCPNCKDRPIKPIPNAPRKTRPKARPKNPGRPTIEDPTKKAEAWKEKPETGDEWKQT